jgi:hypothetical protein
MSSCSRCRQAHSTAKTNWNGDTAEVYVRGGRSSVGHYALLPYHGRDDHGARRHRDAWASAHAERQAPVTGQHGRLTEGRASVCGSRHVHAINAAERQCNALFNRGDLWLPSVERRRAHVGRRRSREQERQYYQGGVYMIVVSSITSLARNLPLSVHDAHRRTISAR